MFQEAQQLNGLVGEVVEGTPEELQDFPERKIIFLDAGMVEFRYFEGVRTLDQAKGWGNNVMIFWCECSDFHLNLVHNKGFGI